MYATQLLGRPYRLALGLLTRPSYWDMYKQNNAVASLFYCFQRYLPISKHASLWAAVGASCTYVKLKGVKPLGTIIENKRNISVLCGRTISERP